MHKLEMTIRSTTEEARRVDAAIEALCADCSVLVEDSDTVRLSIAEALSNIITHGYRGATDRSIRVDCVVNINSIDIEIEDQGEPIPVDRLADPALPEFDGEDLVALPEGGWGLFIIKSHMDEVDYRSQAGVNLLRLSKRTGDAAKPSVVDA